MLSIMIQDKVIPIFDRNIFFGILEGNFNLKSVHSKCNDTDISLVQTSASPIGSI